MDCLCFASELFLDVPQLFVGSINDVVECSWIACEFLLDFVAELFVECLLDVLGFLYVGLFDE